MPISIVVGGQFGSEGKGKVALEIVRSSSEPVTAIRVGGPNSGHTAFDRQGRRWALRQMPAACVDRNVDVFFTAGSYLDVDLLFQEIEELDYPPNRIFISHYANVVTKQHKDWETEAGLISAIGSTGSGVGGAVMASVARKAKGFPLQASYAREQSSLQPYLCDTTTTLYGRLQLNHRIVIEGTQGFGLSLLDGGYWPNSTSRATTAAGALSESGLSPRDVDDITMVIRSFPIRVAGDSGHLVEETTWEEIARNANLDSDIREYTTVTQKLRRVGKFDPELVRRALAANNPTRLVLNHMDYVGPENTLSNPESRTRKFIAEVERDIGRNIDWTGFSGMSVTKWRGVAV